MVDKDGEKICIPVIATRIVEEEKPDKESYIVSVPHDAQALRRLGTCRGKPG
jgi:hypothetical protein